MLSCILLLDSAFQFSLKEGVDNFPRGAEKKSLFSVSLRGI